MKLFLIYFLGLFTALKAFESDNLRYRKSLEFNRGYLTEGNHPVNQLQCVNDQNNLCDRYLLNHATCRNNGRSNRGIIWRCTAVLPSNIRFNKMTVNCEKYPGSFDADVVIKNSCALIYSLKNGNSSIGGIILAVILAIVFLSLIGYCCVRCSRSSYTDHVYTGPPTVITTNRPAVYTVPVAPAIVPVPTYFPNNHHHHYSNHHTNYGYSNTHVDSGLANTSFRGNDDNFGSGFGGTDYRNNDNFGGNDASYGDTSYR